MDAEFPRDPDSISNRQQLMKTLHIERLIRKNKVINFYSYFVQKIKGWTKITQKNKFPIQYLIYKLSK